MVMIIIHIAYITCLVTNDSLLAYDVIGVYKIHHVAGRVSYFMEPAIMWLAGTVMGEVGTHKIFHEAKITVDFSSLPRVLVHFKIQIGRKRPCTNMSTLVF